MTAAFLLSAGAVRTSVEVALTLYGRISWQCGTCRSGVLDQLVTLAPMMLFGAVVACRLVGECPVRFVAQVATLTGVTFWIGVVLWVELLM